MIYYYDSTMPGAPVVSGSAGALRAVLKACLVEGFGASAVTSITVAGGVATANYASQHAFKRDAVALIAGATPSALNGEKKVLSITTTSLTFAAPGVPDGTATGTITSKVASAGWQELFAGTVENVIVLKPTAVEATGCVLRVDDTTTTYARVAQYESMTDANTGEGRTPTTSQQASLFWPKSESASTTSRAWRLIADGRFVYWFCQGAQSPTTTYTYGGMCYGFGDLVPAKSGDPYACIISGATESGFNQANYGDLTYGSGSSAVPGYYLPRAATGIGSALAVQCTAAYNTSGGYSGSSGYRSNTLPFPNGPDNSLRISKAEMWSSSEGVRGTVPGMYHSPQRLADNFPIGQVVDGQGDFLGRRLLVLRCVTYMTSYATDAYGAGTAFVDLTGPWR